MKFSALAFFLSAFGAVSTFARPMSHSCTVMKVEMLNVRSNTEELDEYHCELDPEDANGVSGIMAPLKLNREQKAAMDIEMNSGELVSGLSTYQNSAASISSKGEILIPSSDSMGTNSFSRLSAANKRKLNQTGKKDYLVVIIDATDYSVQYDAQAISGDVFGNSGDAVNLKSQLYGCSGEKLEISNDYVFQDNNGQDILSAPGVLKVNIDIPLTGSTDGAVLNKAKSAADNKLGVDVNTRFDKIMYVKKGCYPTNCPYAAYAYVNGKASMYQGVFIKYAGVQLHELGHNFGFAHSGMGTANYLDHTCLMGNPLYSDEIGKMCFNPAKSFQIGWYNENVETLDLSVGEYWQGKLVGVADYLNNPANEKIVLKLETHTSQDFFLGFNRAVGVNSQNDLCDNCVTVIQAGNGNGYAQSWNQINPTGGMSSAGQVHKISNFKGSGTDLTIEVLQIDLATNPGTATVRIAFGEINTNCKPWCTEIPIPFKSSNPEATQKCAFTGHCDQCTECL